jgi:arabinose-5-phosphate isomerase
MQKTELAKQVLSEEIEALKLLHLNFPTFFENFFQKILDSKGRVILSGIGKSGYIARKISASLASTGTKSFFIHASEASHGDLGMIDEDDIVLVLSNSGNTSEILDIVHFCVEHKICLGCITMNPDSILGKNSNYPLIIPKTKEASNIHAPTTSALLMLALGDALVVSLHESKGFTKFDYKKNHPGGTLGKTLV